MQRLQWKCNHLQSDRYNSPLEGVRCGGSKTAFSQLSIWIWLTTVIRQEIPLKYWEWITTWLPLMSLYWGPCSTLLAGRNVMERHTEEAVKQEKSNNIQGAISSMLKMNRPLYHDLATVSIRLTEMGRHMERRESQKHLFSFLSPFSLKHPFSLHSMCECLQVCVCVSEKVW